MLQARQNTARNADSTKANFSCRSFMLLSRRKLCNVHLLLLAIVKTEFQVPHSRSRLQAVM